MAKVQDRNRIPGLLRELQALMTHEVQVGVFGDESETMLMIARVHEYGTEITVTERMAGYLAARSRELGLTPDTGGLFLQAGSKIRIPERSFIRTAFDANEKNVAEAAREQIGELMSGKKTAQQILEFIGIQMQSFIIRHIFQADFKPLHPFTVAAKSTSSGTGDRPLTNTGHLGSPSTIKWRVVRRR